MAATRLPIKQSLVIALKQVVFRLIPAGPLYWLWNRNTRRRPRIMLDDLTDHRHFPIEDGVQLHVAWAQVEGVGTGPTASLFILDEEILRLDCFGGAEGHMHVNPEQNKLLMIRRSARIYFEPGSMQDHAERAVFELTKNTQGALLENKLARLRSFSPDPEKLAAAAREMTDYMKALISKHG